MSDIFPGLIEQWQQQSSLTPEQVREMFDDDYRQIRQTIKLVGEDTQNEISVNGKSTKMEMVNWLATNMTENGLQVYANQVREETDD